MAGASTTVLGTLGLAAVMVGSRSVWDAVTLQVQTLVHEAGHAVALLITGNWVHDLRVEVKGGATSPAPDRSLFWPSAVVTGLAGYAAPPVTGLVLAVGLDRGWQPSVVLAVVLVVLTAVVAFHADWRTLLVLAAVAGVVALVYLQGGPGAQVGLVTFLAWLLLLAGFRRTLEIAVVRAPAGSDHARLAELTSVPAGVWALGFALIGLACLVAGARLLLS